MRLIKISIVCFLVSLSLFFFQNCGDLKGNIVSDSEDQEYFDLGSESIFAVTSSVPRCSKSNLGARSPQNSNWKCSQVYLNNSYSFTMEPSWDENIESRSSNRIVVTPYETCNIDRLQQLNALGSGVSQYFVNIIGELCLPLKLKLRAYAWVGSGNSGVGNQFTVCTQPDDTRMVEKCWSDVYQVCKKTSTGQLISASTGARCLPRASGSFIAGCGPDCSFFKSVLK